jgi:lysophospholipase L1-like esterase
MFTGNTTRARAHQVNFPGMTWIRLTIMTAPHGVDLDEIDVHGLSQPNPDTVFFMGDSITSVAFDRTPGHQPSYAEDVHASDAEFFPAMIDGGVQGDRSSDGVGHIADWLNLNSAFSIWALGYGTNDAGENVAPSTFQGNLQTMIDQIKAAGKIPVIARIPYSPLAGYSAIPTYNQIIDQLAAENRLLPGPDLYAWFQSNPGEIGADGIHPTDAGAVSINRLWAEALRSLYVPPPPVPAATAPPPPAPTPTPTPTPSPSPAPSTSSGGNSKGCGLLGLEALFALLLIGTDRRRAPRKSRRES